VRTDEIEIDNQDSDGLRSSENSRPKTGLKHAHSKRSAKQSRPGAAPAFGVRPLQHRFANGIRESINFISSQIKKANSVITKPAKHRLDFIPWSFVVKNFGAVWNSG